jgi:glycosyltransferase involved in cell wall biosynthesis
LARPPRARRLLAVGHSYCVALNRRLPNEMAKVGGEEWAVTAVAPGFFHGDLRQIRTESQPDEACRLLTVPALLSRYIHVFFYGPQLGRILREPWDVIHCWEEPFILAGGQVAWLTPRSTPLVFWTGQNIAKKYPPPFSMIENYCVERCAGWMARGQTGVDALLQRNYGRRPHRAVPLGVDIDRFRPDPEARRCIRARLDWAGSDAPVVGFLGRFVEEKGIEVLTAALDELACEWRAMFVGGGPLENHLHNWSTRYAGRVRIVTGVDHDQVPGYLNAMDVLCAPSLTRPNWREVFGRMLIEAFACGIPVIASDSGEIPNVVSDAGMIVGEHDQAGLVRALGSLLGNASPRRELAARGLDRARTHYSWPAVARQHLDFIDEVLRSAPQNS